MNQTTEKRPVWTDEPHFSEITKEVAEVVSKKITSTLFKQKVERNSFLHNFFIPELKESEKPENASYQRTIIASLTSFKEYIMKHGVDESVEENFSIIQHHVFDIERLIKEKMFFEKLYSLVERKQHEFYLMTKEKGNLLENKIFSLERAKVLKELHHELNMFREEELNIIIYEIILCIQRAIYKIDMKWSRENAVIFPHIHSEVSVLVKDKLFKGEVVQTHPIGNKLDINIDGEATL